MKCDSTFVAENIPTEEEARLIAAAPELLEACRLALLEMQVPESDFQEDLADFLMAVTLLINMAKAA